MDVVPELPGMKVPRPAMTSGSAAPLPGPCGSLTCARGGAGVVNPAPHQGLGRLRRRLGCDMVLDARNVRAEPVELLHDAPHLVRQPPHRTLQRMPRGESLPW